MLSDSAGSVKDKIAILNGVGIVKEKANKDEFDAQVADNVTQLSLKVNQIDLTAETNARLSDKAESSTKNNTIDTMVKSSQPMGLSKNASLESSQNGFIQNSGLSFPNSLALSERNGSIHANGDIHMGGVRNVLRYTEDLSYNYHTVYLATKDPATTETFKGIVLSKITSSSFYGTLSTNTAGMGVTVFETGKQYIASAFIKNLSATERFFWPKYLTNNSTNGDGGKLLDNNVRRFFKLFTATDDRNPSCIWFTNGLTGYDMDLRIGGFQIEKVPDGTKHGVAVIGDSTVAGSSGKTDILSSLEWTRYAEGLMSIPFYNRGVGGEGTQQMIDRWVADITPLFATCKYVIIQGGINDLLLLTSAQIVANHQTMDAMAVTDGFIPIHATITPCDKTGAEETTRLASNDLIKKTFARVLDFDSVIKDIVLSSKIKSLWTTDGTHYTTTAKRVLGEYIAGWNGWDFVLPSPYQKVTTTTPVQAGDIYFDKNNFGPIMVDRTNGNKYRAYMSAGVMLFEIVP